MGLLEKDTGRSALRPGFEYNSFATRSRTTEALMPPCQASCAASKTARAFTRAVW